MTTPNGVGPLLIPLLRGPCKTLLDLEDASPLAPSPGGEGWGEGSSGQPNRGYAKVSPAGEGWSVGLRCITHELAKEAI